MCNAVQPTPDTSFRDAIWADRHGRKCKVRELSDAHLHNIFWFFERNQDIPDEPYFWPSLGDATWEIAPEIIAEMEFRGLKPWATT